MHIEHIGNKPITIVDIEEIDGLGDEAHPAYRVTFDDGTAYEGYTTADGSGGDGYDWIESLRIGDRFANMDEFLDVIH